MCNKAAMRALAALAILVLGMPANAATQAQEPPTQPQGEVTALPRLNVRSGPGEGFRVIAGLPHGTRVALVGRDVNGHWIRIRAPASEVTGWVTAFFLEIDENANVMDLPIIDVPDAEALTRPDPDVSAGPLGPVIPTVTEHARAIYLRGQELGNDPHVFTIVGDCNSYHHYFLALHDYNLGEYAYLQAVIDHFDGSFGQLSQATWQGFSPASVLDPTWSNPTYCEPDETPLACEYRIRRPSVAFVSLGSIGYDSDSFMEDMQTIVEYSIEQGVIPILGTKADNVEGNGWVNLFIEQLAAEYDVPLWNFWRAAQALPNNGLAEDNWHLVWAEHDYTKPAALQAGWPVRNLTALQTLDAVWRGAMYQPSPPAP